MLTNFPVHGKAPASAAVLGESGLIHRYMRYSVGTRSPFKLAALWWQLTRYRPDVVIYVMPVRHASAVRRDALFFKLAGIKTIIGLPSSAESTHRFDETTNTFESEANRLARSVRVLGNAEIDKLANWDLRLSASERATAAQFLARIDGRPYLVCAPGTKMQAKDWGTDNWAALLGRLAQRFPEHGVVFVGSREERETCDLVAKGWSGASLNLCGQLSPRETAAVIEQAILFTGPDSGPMHLAAAVATPCAIAFSARGKPGTWFPHGNQHQVVYHQVSCFACNLETCILEQKKCLTSISVDEMYRAVIAASRPSPKETLTV